MLRYLYGHDLWRFPTLRDSMYLHRGAQFKNRLNWNVRIDGRGHERDEYDALDPLYVLWENVGGTHGGSMRFLPTVGRTMVNDHFKDLTGGVTIQSPLIWECTRFCLAPGKDRTVASALVLGAGEIMENFHLSHFLGVFDRRMERIYRHHSVFPDVIGQKGEGNGKVCVGLWEMTDRAWEPTLARVGISREVSRKWFRNSIALQPCMGQMTFSATKQIARATANRLEEPVGQT